MKKLISLLMVLFLTALVFAGCGSGATTTVATTSGAGSSATSGTTAATTAAGKVQVQFWHSMSGNNGDLTNQLVKDFNASQNAIEVVATFQGNYAEAAAKAEQAIFAGNSPDILQAAQDNVGRLAMNGQFADLLPYMNKDKIDPKDFVEAFVKDAYYDGKMVAVPYGRSAQLLHVNKTVLDSVGCKVPTTLDELVEVANKCVVKNGNEITRYGLSIPFDQWQLFAFIQQAGGSFFNKDKTALGFLEDGVGYKVFKMLKDMQASGALYYNDQANNLDTKMFVEGMAAMSIGSSGGITSRTKSIGDKFDYVVAPLVKDKIYSMPTGGCGFGILAASKYKDQAWEFIKWYIQDQKGGLAFVVGSGYLPFTQTMAKSETIQNLWKSNDNFQIAFNALQYGDDSYRIANLTPVIAEFQTCIQAIMFDNQDINKALDNLNAAVKIILKS